MGGVGCTANTINSKINPNKISFALLRCNHIFRNFVCILIKLKFIKFHRVHPVKKSNIYFATHTVLPQSNVLAQSGTVERSNPLNDGSIYTWKTQHLFYFRSRRPFVHVMPLKGNKRFREFLIKLHRIRLTRSLYESKST